MYDFEDEEDDVFGPPSTITPPKQSKIDFSAELNADQFAAVTANDGPALVLAGAGSGKTRTLTYRVAFLLENGVPPSQFFFLPLPTKLPSKCSKELKSLLALQLIAFSGTFHHVGGQVLRLYGDTIGLPRNFTILDDGDSDSLLNEIIRDLDPDFSRQRKTQKQNRSKV